MKNLILKSLLGLACWPAATLFSQVLVTHQFSNIDQAIPDNDFFGVSNTQILPSAGGAAIMEIRVNLTIQSTGAGAFNGDYYAYLTHGDGIAILLNRSGRDAGQPFGSAGDGFNVTFDDHAADGDIHSYSGFSSTQPVTGTWAPDARGTIPFTTLSTDARTLFLSQFAGADLGGEWTLFVADMDSGGVAQISSWGIEATVVPEPATIGIVASISLAGFALARKRFRSRV